MRKTKEHLSQQAFAGTIQENGLLDSSEIEHISKCDICEQAMTLFNRTKKLAGDETVDKRPQSCSVEDLSLRITGVYDGSLDQKAAANFLNLAVTSDSCFAEIFAIIEESLTPVSKDLAQALQTYSDTPLADAVLEMAPPIRPDSWFSHLKKNVGNFEIKMPKPAIAWAALVCFAFALGGTAGWQYWQSRTFWGTFVYDENTPVKFDTSNLPMRLRSGLIFDRSQPAGQAKIPSGQTTLPPEAEPGDVSAGPESYKDLKQLALKPGIAPRENDLEVFLAHFATAVRDYRLLKYEKAITRLRSFIPLVNSLQQQRVNKNLKTIHDYHFLLGMSFFARSRSSETADLDENQRRWHNEQAIAHLTQAQSLAKENDLTNADAGAYFLAVAHGFAGDARKALNQLAAIDSSSRFYQRSLELSEKWRSE